MPTEMDEALTKIDRSRQRLDNFLAARVAREHQVWLGQERVRNDALGEERVAELEQARRYGDACVRHQSRYDAAYRALGTSGAPARDEGEYPGDYRRRLMRGLQDKLPSDHPWAGVDPDELDKTAIGPVEQQVIEAAGQEAENPSPELLPKDDSMIARTRTDPQSGGRIITWYGRKSFIHEMGRPARKVVRICDPDTQRVLWGRPFSTPTAA
jgi:hypothetical protein